MSLVVGQPLFKMSGRNWRKIVNHASKRGIGKSINTHRLRHSCATYLNSRGSDIMDIRDYLGHSSVKTTELYIHSNKQEMEKKIAEAFS